MSNSLDAPFYTLLGRAPSPTELDETRSRGIIATAKLLAASNEHASFVRSVDDQAHLLAGSELALKVYPPGTLSPCATGLVGLDGVLLLAGGSNLMLSQYLGRVSVSADWLKYWCQRVDIAREGARDAGAQLVQVIIPDNLSVQSELYPGPEVPVALRPVERLLSERPTVSYPIEAMRAAPGNPCLVTDTHISPTGAAAVLAEIMHRLDLTIGLPDLELGEFMLLGDLGLKFVQRICETIELPFASGTVKEVETGAGAEYRVVRNPAADHDARVVIFGDSYTVPSPPGIQGSLGDLLTRSFSCVHFRRGPLHWDERLVDRVRPDIIIQEMAERFLNPGWEPPV